MGQDKDEKNDGDIPSGITVGGNTDLKDYLENLLKEEKTADVEDIRKEAESKRDNPKIKGKYAYEEETKKVRKRVKRWTDREIRKEYGIMDKPFDTNTDNIIWIIMEKGPVSVVEINHQLGDKMQQSTASAAVAGIWARLGSDHEHAADILSREQKGLTFYYQKKQGVDVSVESAIEKSKLVGKKQYRDKIAKKKAAAAAADPPPAKPEETDDTQETVDTQDPEVTTDEETPAELKDAQVTADEIVTSVQKAIDTGGIAVNINIEKIELVFKFGL